MSFGREMATMATSSRFATIPSMVSAEQTAKPAVLARTLRTDSRSAGMIELADSSVQKMAACQDGCAAGPT